MLFYSESIPIDHKIAKPVTDDLIAEFFDGWFGVPRDYQEGNSVLASPFFLRIKIHESRSRIEEMACAMERSFLLPSSWLRILADLSVD